MALSETELLSYACSKFEAGNYEEALEIFVLLYTKGFEQEWILNTVYSCYMEGNQEEFQKTFDRLICQDGISCEECVLDFVPHKECEYYIFDKNIRMFRGKFSVHDLETIERNRAFRDMEFSAGALVFDGNWSEILDILSGAEQRKLYAVCQDMRRGCSFFKIPELEKYLKNVKLFPDYQKFQDYFHRNTAEYLPRVLFGEESAVERLESIIEQEHQYRLTPEGRNTSNVLLTIGIPTYNRGNLLLKRLKNLRRMPFDSEIEIAISKNGTEMYQEEYEEAGRIPDARINYFGYDRTLNPTENWHHVVEMAHGKYVLFVSDEDDVILEALEHYLRVLVDHPEINLVRAATILQNPDLETAYAKKGIEAFKMMFLSQNYLSSLIVRKKDFIEEKLLKLEKYKDNVFYRYYPHEWWCVLLTRRGDAMKDSVALISEGDSVLEKEAEAARKAAGALKEDESEQKGKFLPEYSTYEARLEQFGGYIDFLHIMVKGNTEETVVGLEQTMRKTAHLLLLARYYKYECEKYESMIGRFCKMAMEAVEEFDLEDGDKIYLLGVLERCCIFVLQEAEKLDMEANEA